MGQMLAPAFEGQNAKQKPTPSGTPFGKFVYEHSSGTNAPSIAAEGIPCF